MTRRFTHIVGHSQEKLERVVQIYNKGIAGEVMPLPGDATSKVNVRDQRGSQLLHGGRVPVAAAEVVRASPAALGPAP